MKYPFHAVVEKDFSAVDRLIIDRLCSRVPLVEEIGHYLVEAGGKRLRPLVVLLTTNACGYLGKDRLKLAAVIEFLHTAMLLHDDVVDASNLRRGRETVNAAWGNPASVLVGDFLHSRAFEMMVEIGHMKVMQILSHSTNIIAEGEVQQLANLGNPHITEKIYLQVIKRKTATLFQAASHSAVALSGQVENEQALSDFGLHLGMAFQLIDDVLDYEGSTELLGKNIGDDLAEGKVTLPLIVTMRDGNKKHAEIVRTAIQQRSAENLNEIVRIVQNNGALDYTRELANTERNLAHEMVCHLPASSYRDNMIALADFAVTREY